MTIYLGRNYYLGRKYYRRPDSVQSVRTIRKSFKLKNAENLVHHRNKPQVNNIVEVRRLKFFIAPLPNCFHLQLQKFQREKGYRAKNLNEALSVIC